MTTANQTHEFYSVTANDATRALTNKLTGESFVLTEQDYRDALCSLTDLIGRNGSTFGFYARKAVAA